MRVRQHESVLSATGSYQKNGKSATVYVPLTWTDSRRG